MGMLSRLNEALKKAKIAALIKKYRRSLEKLPPSVFRNPYEEKMVERFIERMVRGEPLIPRGDDVEAPVKETRR